MTGERDYTRPKDELLREEQEEVDRLIDLLSDNVARQVATVDEITAMGHGSLPLSLVKTKLEEAGFWLGKVGEG